MLKLTLWLIVVMSGKKKEDGKNKDSRKSKKLDPLITKMVEKEYGFSPHGYGFFFMSNLIKYGAKPSILKEGKHGGIYRWVHMSKGNRILWNCGVSGNNARAGNHEELLTDCSKTRNSGRAEGPDGPEKTKNYSKYLLSDYLHFQNISTIWMYTLFGWAHSLNAYIFW